MTVSSSEGAKREENELTTEGDRREWRNLKQHGTHLSRPFGMGLCTRASRRTQFSG